MKKIKHFRSPDYNYTFNRETGFFVRWGRTIKDDAEYSKYGPEIADIEVTTICNHGCKFCYKANNPNGKNMSFDTFKEIFDKMPKTLTQIAFGADANATSNPDLIDMMRYARANGVIPNITVADITEDKAKELADLCGAVAVSRYENKDACYNTVKHLTDAGLKQVNIHYLLHDKSMSGLIETFNDYVTDERLKGLNAIVILSLKCKGRAKTGFNPVAQEDFTKLVDLALSNDIPIGFDSCGSSKFLKAIENNKDKEAFEVLVEPCESSLFSSYFNTDGEFFPCSFTEGEGEWATGIPISEVNGFIADIWNNEKVVRFRETLLKCGRNCPIFKV